MTAAARERAPRRGGARGPRVGLGLYPLATRYFHQRGELPRNRSRPSCSRPTSFPMPHEQPSAPPARSPSRGRRGCMCSMSSRSIQFRNIPPSWDGWVSSPTMPTPTGTGEQLKNRARAAHTECPHRRRVSREGGSYLGGDPPHGRRGRGRPDRGRDARPHGIEIATGRQRGDFRHAAGPLPSAFSTRVGHQPQGTPRRHSPSYTLRISRRDSKAKPLGCRLGLLLGFSGLAHPSPRCSR